MKSKKKSTDKISNFKKLIEKSKPRIKSGKFEEARNKAINLFDKDKNDPEITFTIAFCEENIGNTESSISWYEKTLLIDTKHTRALKSLGEIYFKKENYEKAESIYTKLHNIDINNMFYVSHLAYIYNKILNLEKEYIFLLKLKKSNVLDENNKVRIVQCLALIHEDFYYEGIENDLIDFLEYKNVDHTKLSWKITNIIRNKYKFYENKNFISTDAATKDCLLVKALPKVLFISPEIEKFLTHLRSLLLFNISYSQKLSNDLIPLIKALSLQCHLNDYVFYLSEKEKEMLDLCRQLLEAQTNADNWNPQDSELALLTLSLYGQLYDLPQKKQLLSVPLKMWPQSLQDIAKETLFDVHIEQELSLRIPALTDINNEISRAVRAQYEENPYPRWKTLDRYPFENFGTSMAAVLPNFTPTQNLLKDNIKILIAGCGTGRQPLSYAIQMPNSSITAIDISRRSLAYAKMKSNEYGIGNVNFFHADILELYNYDEKFDLIISSGVLHHLDDPIKGWGILKKLLKDDGVLQIDIYSKIARHDIVKHRNYISKLGIIPNIENIRKYRQYLLTHDNKSFILNLLDFYNTNMCRDLIFHIKEHQFTFLNIKEYCENLNMEFIGLNAKFQIYNIYKNKFPEDVECRNLENWHFVEQQYPQLFWGMYSFWCRSLNTENFSR